MDLSVEVKIPKILLFDRGNAGTVVRDELRTATEASVHMVQGAILPLVPVNQGILRAGVQTAVDVSGGAVDVFGRVFNPVQYALAVESGSRPHWPPRGPIELWVRRKLGVPEGEVRSVAYLVARAISRRGTRPAHSFARGFRATRAGVKAEYREALKRVVARLAGRAR